MYPNHTSDKTCFICLWFWHQYQLLQREIITVVYIAIQKVLLFFQSVFLGSLNMLDALYLKTCTKIGKSIMTWNIQSCKRRETEQLKSEGRDNAVERQTDGNVNNVLQYLIYQIRKKINPLGLLNLYGEFF